MATAARAVAMAVQSLMIALKRYASSCSSFGDTAHLIHHAVR